MAVYCGVRVRGAGLFLSLNFVLVALAVAAVSRLLCERVLCCAVPCCAVLWQLAMCVCAGASGMYGQAVWCVACLLSVCSLEAVKTARTRCSVTRQLSIH